MNEMQPKLRLFFVSSALSTFGDEVWEIALPIFFAASGFTSRQMGGYYSVFAAGTAAVFIATACALIGLKLEFFGWCRYRFLWLASSSRDIQSSCDR